MSKHNIVSETKKDSSNAKRRNKAIHLTTKKIGCLSITLRNTSNFDDHAVWTAVTHTISGISFQHHSRVDVTVTNSYKDSFRGKCYSNGCTLHSPDPCGPLIIARITPEEKQFPDWVDRTPLLRERVIVRDEREVVETKKVSSGGYISCWLLDRTECLIYVLSHEFRHLWQMEHKRGRVWGARGTFSDRDADAFAIRKVRKHRKLMQRQTIDKALSSASAFFSLPLVINKKISSVIDEEIKSQPTDIVTEDCLISLLHLRNQQGLQSFVKHQSFHYYTLERYLYSDIIPEEPVHKTVPLKVRSRRIDYSSC